MRYCLTCNKTLGDSGIMDHMFCGYGFCFYYCAECCPGEADGSKCSDIECYERKTGKQYEEA